VRVQNHYKMGCMICKEMKTGNMPLNKVLFILGNLAPDLFFSFLYRPHLRSQSASHLKKVLRRLYKGGITPERLRFSFYSGVLTHYVCDFLCYAHTPAFTGSMREHIRYEKQQTVNARDLLPFDVQKSMNLSLSRLTDILDEYILRREQFFMQNAERAGTDIPIAIYVATWAASSVYLHAEASRVDILLCRTEKDLIPETLPEILAAEMAG